MISIDNEKIKTIINTVEKQGYIVLENCINKKQIDSIQSRVLAFKETDLKNAGIGRSSQQQNNSDIRRDKIHWLDSKNKIDNEYLQLMETLRIEFNQSLYIGLFDYEAHYSIYKEGDFYAQHIDALKGKSNRVLSTVLYLNEHWQEDNGGELVLYDQDKKTILETVIPRAGTMVIFLSEQFPHEVLAAKQSRYSIAGWFRVNASNSQCVDTSH